MKIGLILPGNLWFCPYVNIYTQILKDNNIDYDIISWNRDGSELAGETVFDLNVTSFNRYQKLTPFLKYLNFIKKTLKKKKYQKIIVFGPQLGLLLYPFLKNNYKNKFILDYRDLSIEQLPFLNVLFRKVLSISSINILSSEGFKKYLPKGEYVISHNFSSNKAANRNESSDPIFEKETVDVLTIGSIRDYEANLELVKALGNKNNIKVYFVGKGAVSSLLENYVKDHNIVNVFFHGFYEKAEEAGFIRNASFLNIYYPKIKSHSSALSNRFYNALIYKRPMIVTSNSIQGEFVENYKLGLSINDCTDLYDKILSYKSNFEADRFDLSSENLLEVFKSDYDVFYGKIFNFVNNN